MENKYTIDLNKVSLVDIGIVGGKNASLGQMIQNLKELGIAVPNGFAINVNAYYDYIKHNNLENKIKQIIKDLDDSDIISLRRAGSQVRQLIRNGEFPDDLKSEIREKYEELSLNYDQNMTDVAVRSSATAEDLPDASFAGQQETFLNVRGIESIIEAVRNCFASLFTDRAISYRNTFKYDHFDVGLSVCIQKMVRSDLASSGVAFSIDTESGFKNVILINASYGLGEMVVQGSISPDEFLVFKPLIDTGFSPIIEKKLGHKDKKMIYGEDHGKLTKIIQVSDEQKNNFCIDDKKVLQISKWVKSIENYYSEIKGKWCPVDVEWAIDGITDKLYIVQARPETIHSRKETKNIIEYNINSNGQTPIIQGIAVGDGVACGQTTIMFSLDGRDGSFDASEFVEGSVLVTDMTDPDWEPIMKKASAIITNKGGRTCFDGETKILTNKGFMKIKDVQSYDGELLTLSLNRSTLKVEWKPIIDTMVSTSELIEIETGLKKKKNSDYLRLTPSHKMLTYINSDLNEKKIEDILKDNEMLLCADYIPKLNSSNNNEKLAYMLGVLSTDGGVYLNENHGEVQFIQKGIPEKEEFIKYFCNCFEETFDYKLKEKIKPLSNGFIRGKKVVGQASAFRCYSKSIATFIKNKEKNFIIDLLNATENYLYSFLAGICDGDGSYKNGRINIYCSEKNLLEAIIISCLKLKIFPQITNNRNIWNIQIVEGVENILQYTNRLKYDNFKRKRNDTKFFSAKQLLSDFQVKSKFWLNIKNNLLVGKNKLLTLKNSKILKEEKDKIDKIICSDTRMKRVSYIKNLDKNYVYNITVQDNHNYIVFSNDYTPIIVNNCHAAIVARELGVPAIVGCRNATETLRSNQNVTVSCSEGDIGFVYEGFIECEKIETRLEDLPKIETPIMLNVASPDIAFKVSHLPNYGVGLAREEFIINNYIKVHPLALLNHKELNDPELSENIKEIINGFKDEETFFIKRLSYGIAKIAAAFFPKKVIVRLSDFKSNEYENLLGGKYFEPKEENPMIGWRGASRYYSNEYREAFGLEIKAIKRVREKMGLTNVTIMIPFCRTVDELLKVYKVMEYYGLKRGDKDLEIYLMAELPSNILMAEEFANHIDGFSIGSNDLTQLVLGLDRDSALVSHIYDERNIAVKRAISQLIKVGKKTKTKVGICGQGPSDFPDFAEFLVEEGIDSISVTPDSILKVLKMLDKKN